MTEHRTQLASALAVSALLTAGCSEDGVRPAIEEPPAMPPAIVINELLAGTATYTSPQCGSSDWIEIYNADSIVFALNTLTLTDFADTDLPWVIESDDSLAPGKWHVICADNEPGNAPFRLSQSGEAIGLGLASGTVLDSVVFGALPLDVSWARLPDGSSDWQELPVPTPGKANEPIPTIVINEIVPDTSYGSSQCGVSAWLELHNTGTISAAVSSLTLTDYIGPPWPIESSDTLAPGDWYVVCAGTGQGNAPVLLSHDGGSIGLGFGSDTVLDSVMFQPIGPDSSWARWPDGSSNWQKMSAPTPGETNEPVSPPIVVINELLAGTGTYASPQCAESDWLELYNAGAVSVALGALALTDFSAPPWFVESTDSIAPGEWHIVCANDEPGNAPFRLSQDGETVVLSLGLDVILDSVTFASIGPDSSWARMPNGANAWEKDPTPTPGEENQ